MKPNPFSLYDFLGYLFPGAIFLSGVVVLRRLGQQPNSWSALLTPFSVLGRVEYLIPLLLLAYVLGHILSYLSSVTVERYSVWTLGYPSRYLLGHCPGPFFRPVKARKTRAVVRLIVTSFLCPVSALELLGGRLGLRRLFAKPLDPLLRHCLKERLNRFVTTQHDLSKVPNPEEGEERDVFRLVYHYALENAPAHVPKMQNYVALYGFARTLSFEAVLFFWLGWGFFAAGRYSLALAASLAALAALGGYTLYLDFVKFYRKFSLEALMAVLTTWRPN
jgi:hypothetical protein